MNQHRLIAKIAILKGACQKPDELAELLDIVAEVNPQVIVELGVFAGGTLYAWQRVSASPTVIGIDMMQEAPDGSPRDEHGAVGILGNTHDVDTLNDLVLVLNGRPIDFLFIDGDHSYDGVRQDYEMYSPLVRPGGLIAFHDIVTHQYQLSCEVVKLWCEIKDESAIEIVSPLGDHWGGIGLLRRPGSEESNGNDKEQRPVQAQGNSAAEGHQTEAEEVACPN